MPSIAMIGPDGAGKTTLTRMLERSEVARFKYIYMGIELAKSNITLPSARWIEGVKARSAAGGGASGAGSRSRRAGAATAWAWARLIHRVADEWFRQFVSWWYQARGYVVLYDRHFVFDFAPEIAPCPDESLDKRLHRWYLARLYPRPTLVLFLDAPAELLYARKHELTPPELERRRQGFLQVGQRVRGFVRVDAARPLPEVFAEIVEHVGRTCGRPASAAAEALR